MNFVEFTGAPLEDALRLLTVNPAAMTGLEGEVGSLKWGRRRILLRWMRREGWLRRLWQGEFCLENEGAIGDGLELQRAR